MSHHLLSYVLLSAHILWLTPTRAQSDAEPLSLARAIELGLANNYQIQMADRAAAIAGVNNDWAIAGAYPNVNVGLNWNNNYNASENPAGFLLESQIGSSNISPFAEAVWTLYDGGRVKLTKQQLEELERKTNGQARLVVETTIQRIILAYYNAQLREEQLTVLEEVLNLSRDRMALEQLRQEFGQASTFDLLQTKDAYLNDSTTFLTQYTEYQNALRELNMAMGIDDLGRRYRLTDAMTLELQGLELETLRARMLASNNQLQDVFADRELSRINTRILESSRLPSVDLRSGLIYNYNRNWWGSALLANGNDLMLGGVRNTAFNAFVNVSLSYNIYDFGVRKRNIENAKLQEINAQTNVEEVKRNLNLQLENTYAIYLNQQELVEVLTQLLDNARRNLEIAAERFRGGLISVFDYRTIQLSYINASQSRLNAIFNLKIIETDLRQLAGGLVR
jgi:outer membrane protein